MTRGVLCLAMATLPALGQPGAASPVAIYTEFQHEPPRAIFDSIQREVSAVMSPLGLPFEWRSLANVRGNEVSALVAVVTFKGKCDVDGLAAADREPGPMGATHISDGAVLPFTDVDCGRIRGFLRSRLLGLDPRDREGAFARAVGRVVAHELFHIFAGTRRHASGGIARPAYRERELLSDEFRFEAKEVQTLRAGMLPALLEQRKARGPSQDSPRAGLVVYRESGCAACHGGTGEGGGLGPALRAPDKPVNFSLVASKLWKDVVHMYRNVKDRKVAPPALDDIQIGDLVSFLNTRAE